MTKERLAELRYENRFGIAVVSRKLEECLDEIERLTVDRDHWRKEYKTLELAGDELLKRLIQQEKRNYETTRNPL